MKCEIYHDENPSFGLGSPREFPTDFVLVAEIDHDAPSTEEILDEAYRLTNHLDSFWWNASKVICHKQSRSTSIGDVAICNNEVYVCVNFGWRKIGIQGMKVEVPGGLFFEGMPNVS